MPYSWKKPKMVLVNSMSDLFHKNVPLQFIQKVFAVTNDNPQHVFQILTKRADLLQYYDSKGFLEWGPNIWMGVSIENEKVLTRVDSLRRTGAKIKFLSCEPLIGPLYRMNLKNIGRIFEGRTCDE